MVIEFKYPLLLDRSDAGQGTTERSILTRVGIDSGDNWFIVV